MSRPNRTDVSSAGERRASGARQSDAVVAARRDRIVDWVGAEGELTINELVDPGLTILIDDSTTCLPLAALLAERGSWTVITNFVEIARLLGPAPNVELLLLGGEYAADFDAVFGPDVHRRLADIRADAWFGSAPAVSRDTAYHPVRNSAAIKQAMIDASARHFLLVDHSKFGATAPYAFARANEFDALVTTDETPDGELESWESVTRVIRTATPR